MALYHFVFTLHFGTLKTNLDKSHIASYKYDESYI